VGLQGAKQLPSVGSKMIAVYGGNLIAHGKPRPVTWTRLASTAAAGTNTITLNEAVDWVAGEKVIIAATGFDHNESEPMLIQSIDATNKVITLSANLEYTHYAATQN